MEVGLVMLRRGSFDHTYVDRGFINHALGNILAGYSHPLLEKYIWTADSDMMFYSKIGKNSAHLEQLLQTEDTEKHYQQK